MISGRGEWVLHNDKLLLQDYVTLAPQFYPTEFNATLWVETAKSAGMRYITFTAKHHDGFCMWHTKQTEWNIVDATPFKIDVLMELSIAARAADIPLFIYYSPLDWSHPDYYPRGMTVCTSLVCTVDLPFSHDLSCFQSRMYMTRLVP